METKRKGKRRAVVDQRICVACGACQEVCPKGAIAVWKGCFARVADNCVGCGICERTCPAGCIGMEVREAVNG